MSTKYTWGVPSTTSGWQNYPNGWVYTGGISMPTARVDYYGNRPIRIHTFGDYYNSSGWMVFNYLGVIGGPGGVYVIPSSGGTIQWEAHSNSLMYFGRDLGAGRTVRSVNDGYTWAGTLAGSLYWDQVPTAPGISAVATSRSVRVTVTAPSNNGGTGVDQYTVQYSFEGGAWTGTRHGGSTTYDNLAPGSYQFRAWCHNAVGYSVPAYSGTVVVLRAGSTVPAG
jgi:hypothetical protein